MKRLVAFAFLCAPFGAGAVAAADPAPAVEPPAAGSPAVETPPVERPAARPARRTRPADVRARAPVGTSRPVQVTLPAIVIPVRRPRALEIGRANVSTERVSARPTFVDGIARSVSKERL